VALQKYQYMTKKLLSFQNDTQTYSKKRPLGFTLLQNALVVRRLRYASLKDSRQNQFGLGDPDRNIPAQINPTFRIEIQAFAIK